MHQIFIYLAPPLVGAFIGYMTNYVAIRMLFRPLKPWRFLGWRLPMTPGVIPAKRHELAINMGRMVGRHLLTSSDITKALNGRAFKKQLALVIDTKVQGLLNRDLGPLSSIVPKRFTSYLEAGLKILRWRGLKIVHNHLAGDAFAREMAVIIANHIEETAAKPLTTVLPAEAQARMLAVLEKAARNMLTSPGTEEWLSNYIEQKLREIMAAERTPRQLLPAAIPDFILGFVERETPALLAKAARIAEEPGSRDKIVKAVCGAINNFIAGLGPMAALAAGFISPELIEGKVREYLDEHGAELSAWLQGEEVQERLRGILNSWINNLLDQPLSELLANVEEEKLYHIRRELAAQTARALREPRLTAMVINLLSEALKELSNSPIQEVIVRLFGSNGMGRGKDWAAREVVTMFRSREVKQVLDHLLGGLLERKLFRHPIGPLHNFLPKAVQSSLAEYIIEQSNLLMAREVPGLLDSLNLEQMVSKKVDGLDLLQLENLLLGIMEEQFKYINLFGALLGGIIGLLNLVFIL